MGGRLLLLGLLVLVAVPAAASGDPAPPRLVVHGPTGKVPSELVLRNVADTSSVRILVPAGYTLALGQAPGAVVGSADADQRTDSGTARIGGSVAVAPEGTVACDGAPHTAVWKAALADAKQVVAPVIIAVDASPAALLVCAGGTQVDRLTLQLAAATLAPPAQAVRPVWEALVSFPDGSQVASVATLALPPKLTLHASYQRRKHQIALAGLVTEAAAPAPAGRRVVVSIGAQPSTLTAIGATRTHADGSWRGVIANVRRTLLVRAQVVVPDTDTTAGSCAPPTLTVPCVSATAAGYTASSATVRVTVPASRT